VIPNATIAAASGRSGHRQRLLSRELHAVDGLCVLLRLLDWANANVAATIARRPFLPEESRSWVHLQRDMLGRVWRRAMLVLSHVSTTREEFELGIHHASEVVAAEPFDEVACQMLMRAHAAAGNRAEALRVYARCRKLFRDELGSEPSDKTAAAFLDILKA
jgi:DNA-binding SARP family transcriptional activator